MPRKTKKQKILAKLHRLEQKTHEPLTRKEATSSHVKLDNEGLTITNLKPEASSEINTKKSEYDYSYVYKDVRKILIISTIALFVEIALGLTASNGYAKLVLRALNLDI